MSPQRPKVSLSHKSCSLMAIRSNSKKVVRLNPSHWINPSLSSQDIFYASRSHLASQLSRSLANESYFANGRKSQKQKTYGKNVYRFSIPKLIAESFSATVIFFHTLEN
ncbi:hypothetical protein QL285_087379 [Trifolium repens]|nr:hypothetical protein QL285_087379 [Trifolium repens]